MTQPKALNTSPLPDAVRCYRVNKKGKHKRIYLGCMNDRFDVKAWCQEEADRYQSVISMHTPKGVKLFMPTNTGATPWHSR